MRVLLTLIASSALLVACGGGSDSSSSQPGPANPTPGGTLPDTGTVPGPVPLPPPATSRAAINADNYVAVAQQGLALNGFLLNTAGFIVGAQVSDTQALQRAVQGQLLKLPARFAKASAVPVGAVLTDIEPCTQGGTITATLNDRNGNEELDAGESASLVMNNCREDGVLLNGRLSIAVSRLSGDPDAYPFNLSASVELVNFSISDGPLVITGSGTQDIDIAMRSDNEQSYAVRTAQFSSTLSHAGSPTYNQTVRDYALNMQLTPAGRNATVRTTSGGILFSSSLDARPVTIATPEAFVRSSVQPYWSSGQMVITDQTGAKVQARALDAGTVRIELDGDGDGVYETGITQPWSQLL